MKLNKLLALSAVLVSGFALGSCNNGNTSTPATSTPAPESTPAETTAEVSVGLGYAYSFTASSEEKAYAQLDLTAAFVAFDEAGKIVDARIDVVQVKAAKGEESGLQINAGTKLDDAGSIKTKLELGKDYNMVTYGQAIAEVDAQIESFADWTVGQTVEELKANVAAEHGYGTAPHPDLASSVTIVCHDFVAAIESAYNNKTTGTYEQGLAGIAMVSGLSESYGTWEMSVDVAGVLAKDGTIVAAQVDAIVVQLAVSEAGVIGIKEGQKYMGANGELLSKKTLGDDYAMRPASPIQAEWDEQAAAIEEAANGKTADQVKELVAGEGELATATMYVGNYLTALAKATSYAALEHVGPQA